MKNNLFATFAAIFLATAFSSCSFKNSNKSSGGVPEGESFVRYTGKPANLTPAIIIRLKDGKLKAYKGFKTTRCGNPVYNEKDSITSGNFLLVADLKQVLYTVK